MSFRWCDATQMQEARNEVKTAQDELTEGIDRLKRAENNLRGARLWKEAAKTGP